MLSVQSPLVPETLKDIMRVSTVSKAVTPLLSSGEVGGSAIEIVVEITCDGFVVAAKEDGWGRERVSAREKRKQTEKRCKN